MLAGLASEAAAQQQTGSGPGAGPRPTVERLVLERQNVFDSSETVRWYARLANRLHVTTRPAVIERELLFDDGEPYDAARVAESERNLRRTGLFRDVRIDSTTTADSAFVVRVVTRDAWSTKLSVKYGATGSQHVVGVKASESNLLGTAIRAGVSYTSDPDRDVAQLTFAAPRLVAGQVGIDALLEHRTDGKSGKLTLSAPFFSLSDRGGATFSAETFDGQVLRFVGGDPEPSERLRRLFSRARVGVARAPRASPFGYLRVGIAGQVRREDFGPDSASLDLPRTMTGTIEVYGEASWARYATIRNFRSLGKPEDVDLSATVRGGVAFAPAAFGYERDGVGPSLEVRAGTQFRGGFAQMIASATSLFTSAGLDSGTARVAATLALLPSDRHAVVLHAQVGRQWNPAPGAEFDLGLTRGPRAFPAHAFTGDHLFFAMGEYRWTAARGILGLVDLGAALFAEQGGAWFGGSPRRDGVDAGFGLRLAGTRSTGTKGAARLDLARRGATDVEPADWVLVFGTGFPFEALR